MNRCNPAPKPFLIGTIGVLMLGIAIRSTSLLQSHTIAIESNAIGSQMESLRNSLQSSLANIEQPATDLDDAGRPQIQDDLKLVFQDQPDQLSKT
ncbi:MAG: hypothetical protein CMM01_18430, partial [Rhodopirellula sp.]|nr:hypothetical protein [Rhodopirellula sp.]